MAYEILSLTEDMDSYGGAQKVLMDVHEGIRGNYKAKVIATCKFEDLHPKYKIREEEYVRLTNPFYLNNKILIVHCRNLIVKIMILKRLLFLNTKVLYVAHNVYDTYGWLPFFPKDIISISEKVTNNLLSFFKLKRRNIRLIYNGITDEFKPSLSQRNKIVILYLARVNNVKRQLKIVEQLENKLLPEVEIHFGGTGEDYEELVKKCSNSTNFKALGFIEDVSKLIVNSDYLMLYSAQEGLPISLIEGTMYAKPLLVNDVGGNLEIGVPGLNALFLNDDWDKLADSLNALVKMPTQEYKRMSENSRSRYKSMFTYDKMIANYLQVIGELQSGSAAEKTIINQANENIYCN